jgi:hypothetical protein
VETDAEGRSHVSELKWILVLGLLGAVCLVWGHHYKATWLWGGRWELEGSVWRLHSAWGAWNWNELWSIHNTTLPSVVERLGWITLAGALMGFVEMIRPRWSGPNPVVVSSSESLLLYMLHLNLIFGVLLTPAILAFTGWDWNSLGWAGTLALLAFIIVVNLAVGIWWQRVRKSKDFMHQLQRWGLAALAIWFLVGGWWRFQYYLQSPELARQPYSFLNSARLRKGLAATPDGLCRDPDEYFREAARRNLNINAEAHRKILEQIQRRSIER